MSHDSTDTSPARRRRLRSFGLVLVALVVASLVFRFLAGVGLHHTSLLFVGIPAILAWVMASGEPPKTATGSVMRTTTLALLVSWIFLGEAFICVLMAAPIFYLIAGLVAWGKSSGERRRSAKLLPVLLVPLALEGTTPALSTSRDREVVAEAIVSADIEQVRLRLARTPRFDRELPLFFRLGFPTPRHPAGEGLRVGDRRSVMFAHEGHHSGTLSLEIMESTPTRVRFAAVSDDSYLTHWLFWRGAVVELQPVGREQTRVRWTLQYSRRLDPSWYFDPLERYGVTLAAHYLLDNLTTPVARTP
jgi:hypothetical protein